MLANLIAKRQSFYDKMNNDIEDELLETVTEVNNSGERINDELYEKILKNRITLINICKTYIVEDMEKTNRSLRQYSNYTNTLQELEESFVYRFNDDDPMVENIFISNNIHNWMKRELNIDSNVEYY